MSDETTYADHIRLRRHRGRDADAWLQDEEVQQQQQWRIFVEDVALNPGTLAGVIDNLAAFLMPSAKMWSN